MSGDDLAGRDGDPRDGAAPLRSERQRVILGLFASSDRPLSTTEVSQLTRQTLGATAHHVRALARAGYLRWAGERRVRGAVQTYYVISEIGLDAMRAPRIGALIELAGMIGNLPRPGEKVRGMPQLDEEALRQIEELIEEIRPRLEDIGRALSERALGEE